MMEFSWVGFIIGFVVGFILGGFIGFIDTRNDLRDFAEFAGRDDITNESEGQKEPIPDYKAEVDRLRYLLKTATDKSNRLAAINQGLTEDLSALKAYDPEEIEERLKKIREIKAEEERKKSLENLERLTIEARAQIALSMLNSGGFSASTYCSLADQQRISWR